MFHVPEKYRWKNHPLLPTDETFGNNGFFVIPHYKIIDYVFLAMVSDGMDWEHVSITVMKKKKLADRTPTWAEMCWMKDLFWDKEDCVMQLHPPESEYVSTHNFCLHLWRPVTKEIPMPSSLMVGRKDLKHKDLENASIDTLRKIIIDAHIDK